MTERLSFPLTHTELSKACVYPTPKVGPKSFNEPVFIQGPFEYVPLYNAAPLSVVPVMMPRSHFQKNKEYGIVSMRWGLSVGTGRDKSLRTHNVPIEEVQSLDLFNAELTNNHRCVILCNGFFLWQLSLGGKQPYYVYQDKELSHFQDIEDFIGKPIFKLAGLFKKLEPDEVEPAKYACSIITKPADERLSELYERMPIVLDSFEDVESWISCEKYDYNESFNFLKMYKQAESFKPLHKYTIKYHEVNKRFINNISCTSERCIEPFTRRGNTLDKWFRKN